MGWRAGIQTVVQTLYPSTCLSCATPTEGGAGLCSPCWVGSHFIAGLVCDGCGVSLMGTSGEDELCDDCLKEPRNWAKGRAVFLYKDGARKLVWDLKYADRSEVATAAGPWLAAALAQIKVEDPLIAPIPLHWTRLLKRKYNQSELLSQALSRTSGSEHAPGLLKRVKRTPTLFNLSKEEREAALTDAIGVNSRFAPLLEGRNVVIVDDVMTTGSTMNAAAKACLSKGARSVNAVFLARAGKND